MPPRVAPATNARGPHATAATGRRNLPLLPLLLLAAGPRTASAQAPVNDAFYLGEGVFLPGGFGQSVAMTSATSAQECDTFCFAGNGLTPAPAGTLVGFTYEPGATTECTCLENSVAGTNQAIEGVFEIPGSNQFQYCYYCASEQPSSQPSSRPSSVPSELPSGRPSSVPSELPSGRPSSVPSELPSGQPSSVPSELPSGQPSSVPSEQPSGSPSENPSGQPSSIPSEQPSGQPSSIPSEHPSGSPSENPSGQPSSIPSEQPSGSPSENPSGQPSSIPSEQPSGSPSENPSGQPSSIPSEQPSGAPSENPSGQPSGVPSENPSGQPSSTPSEQPSGAPSEHPSGQPSSTPSEQPSGAPSEHPSGQPSSSPSEQPSGAPSEHPSGQPSSLPSEHPSGAPSERPSLQPSSLPSEHPSGAPSGSPSLQPSSAPSESPSGQPSSSPSEQPSGAPSFAPSTNPSSGCENIRTDCGWGIFNPWTCRCDCPVGICLDDNEQCYLPCADTIHTNPWAGCRPGWDCPWFPDKSEGHCKSEMHQANNFEIYRTAGECCSEHYGGSATCVADSKASTPPLWPIGFPGSANFGGFAPAEAENIWGVEAGQATRWFPDLQNKRNCVFGNNWENWMNEDGFAAEYLFSNDEDCCEKWYPALGSSCPDTQTAVNPEAEDEAWLGLGGVAQNYYFPDFSVNNCGFGRDYPAWMGINGYEKFYLFREGSECCNRYFAGVGGCPFESTPQTGAYWEAYKDKNDNSILYNHTYYPDIHAGTCVNGTDFPPWMAEDDEFKRLYLFKNLEGCCNYWIKGDVNSCINNVIQGLYLIQPCPLNRPDANCNFNPVITNITQHRLGMWYPDIDGYRCKNDGAVPSWMLEDGYHELYLFNTQKQCCAAFGYC